MKAATSESTVNSRKKQCPLTISGGIVSNRKDIQNEHPLIMLILRSLIRQATYWFLTLATVWQAFEYSARSLWQLTTQVRSKKMFKEPRVQIPPVRLIVWLGWARRSRCGPRSFVKQTINYLTSLGYNLGSSRTQLIERLDVLL